ncbi:MAG: KEOPS complex subunit Cgi121, partial [Chloroflexota bacterium]
MLKYIKEFRKYVAIVGLRNVRIKKPEELLEMFRNDKSAKVEIQFFDVTLVATWEHLYFALLNALTAFRNKDNLSKSIAMETMLYASAQHQITKATELMGIRTSTKAMAVLVVGDNAGTVEAWVQSILKY